MKQKTPFTKKLKTFQHRLSTRFNEHKLSATSYSTPSESVFQYSAIQTDEGEFIFKYCFDSKYRTASGKTGILSQITKLIKEPEGSILTIDTKITFKKEGSLTLFVITRPTASRTLTTNYLNFLFVSFVSNNYEFIVHSNKKKFVFKAEIRDKTILNKEIDVFRTKLDIYQQMLFPHYFLNFISKFGQLGVKTNLSEQNYKFVNLIIMSIKDKQILFDYAKLDNSLKIVRPSQSFLDILYHEALDIYNYSLKLLGDSKMCFDFSSNLIKFHLQSTFPNQVVVIKFKPYLKGAFEFHFLTLDNFYKQKGEFTVDKTYNIENFSGIGINYVENEKVKQIQAFFEGFMISYVDLYGLYFSQVREHSNFNAKINNFISRYIAVKQKIDFIAFKQELLNKFPVLLDYDFRTSLVSNFNHINMTENWTFNEEEVVRTKSFKSFFSQNIIPAKGEPSERIESPIQKIVRFKKMNRAVTINVVPQLKAEEEDSQEQLILKENFLSVLSFSKSDRNAI